MVQPTYLEKVCPCYFMPAMNVKIIIIIIIIKPEKKSSKIKPEKLSAVIN